MSDKADYLRLLLAHEADLRAYIGAQVRDRDRREDVFQDVAVLLWESFERYDATRPFIAWARGVARHRILQLWEKYRNDPITFTPQVIDAIDAAYSSVAPIAPRDTEALRHCVDTLPPQSRHLLDLRYESDLKLHDIARQLGQTTSGAHKALTRLRASLGECIRRRLAAMDRGEA